MDRKTEQELDDSLDDLSDPLSVEVSLTGPSRRLDVAEAEETDSAPLTDEAPGRWIPLDGQQRYLRRGVVGFGGQAQVLSVLDNRLGREVALKEVMRRGVQAERPAQGKTLQLVRFLREAQITGQLEHPNIVPVHDLGRHDDGRYYYTMRLVRGSTLARKLQNCHQLDQRLQYLRVYGDVCNAVAFAHSRGVVHRDLKVENVMVGEFGETVVLDWGVAKVRGQNDPTLADSWTEMHVQGDARKTASGVAVGTPSTMSPEAVQGRLDEVDERSDVWALGVMLHEILTGQQPFRGANAAETMKMIVDEEPLPVREICPQAPAELAAVVEKALQKDRLRRYGNAKEIAKEINAYLTGRRVAAHEYGLWELLRRFGRRHKVALAATLVVMAVVVASLVTVSFAYQRESMARKHEYQSRLSALYSLAVSHQREAERQGQEKRWLASRLHAAASLMNNPAHLSSPAYDRGFARRHSQARLLEVKALGNIQRSDHRHIRGLEGVFRVDAGIEYAAISPDEKWVAAGDTNGLLWLWDRKTGAVVAKIDAHIDPPKANYVGIFAADSKHFVTAGRDQSIKLWRLPEPEPRAVIANLPGWALTLDFLGPKRLLAGTSRGKICELDLARGSSLRTIDAHERGLLPSGLSSDRDRFASVSLDQRLVVWDTATWKPVWQKADLPITPYATAFSRDGKWLALGSADRHLRVFSAAHGDEIAAILTPDTRNMGLLFLPNGPLLASLGEGGHLTLYDSRNWKIREQATAHRGSWSTVQASASGRALVTVGDRQVMLWRLTPDDGLRRYQPGAMVMTMEYAPDGQILVSEDWDQFLVVWDPHSGRRLRSVKCDYPAIDMAFFPDGRRFAAVGPGALVVWDAETLQPIMSARKQEDHFNSVAVGPKGLTLVTGAVGGTVRLWRVAEGQLNSTVLATGARLKAIAFSPDGKLVAAGGEHSVSLLGIGKDSRQQRLEGHQRLVQAVDFSPDGKLLASSDSGGLVILWETATGRILHRFEGQAGITGYASFSPDSGKIVSWHHENMALIRACKSGEVLQAIPVAAGTGRLKFSPDGKRLAIAETETIVSYPLSLPAPQLDARKLLSQTEQLSGMSLRAFRAQVTTK